MVEWVQAPFKVELKLTIRKGSDSSSSSLYTQCSGFFSNQLLKRFQEASKDTIIYEIRAFFDCVASSGLSAVQIRAD